MLSVIIPVYNCKDYLEDCVQGLLPLNEAGCEIILIDDGSTDGSGIYCDELAHRWPCVRCIHQENSGVSSARNRGIDEAKGELILFVDADDSLETSSLFPLIEQMQEDTTLDMLAFGLFFDYYRKGSKYRFERLALPSNLLLDRETLAAQVPALFYENYLSPVWNKLLRRSILACFEIRFDPNLFLLEDLDFSLRYLACCNRVLCSSAAIYHYRQPEDEGNAGRRLQRVQSISSAMEPIVHSFDRLADYLQSPSDSQIHILLDIYLTLARQKIAVSDRETIRSICIDFSAWTQNNNIPPELLDDKLPHRLLTGQTNKIIVHRTYAHLRHKFGCLLRYTRHLIHSEQLSD